MDELQGLSCLAKFIGCPEAGLRLLISLLLGYPIAIIHRKVLYDKPPFLQHIYFIFFGVLICFFNYGWDVLHSFTAITVTYLVLKILGGSFLSVLIVFVYTMLHLLMGYWTTATTNYDIKWTMPQCVLTLRLIGLAFNVYDGKKPRETLSEDDRKTALEKLPSALEVFAHSYFPASFLVGPQMPVKRYLGFVNHTLGIRRYGTTRSSTLPQSVIPGLTRFGLGLTYLVIYQIGNWYVNDDYIISDKYKILPIWKKFLLLGLWSRITLYKYISCWLITEGSCIYMGLTYNGIDQNGKEKWNGCSNVHLKVFENTTKMNHYIESFNINTNHWVAQYIYKRLKFLKMKTLSYIGTLFFLAVWHGFHSGYYATFFFEFIIIKAEKNVISALRNTKFQEFVDKPFIYPFIYIILRLYTFVIMGYAMIPFILLKYKKYLPVFAQFYFSVHIICIIIIAVFPFLSKRQDAQRHETIGLLPKKHSLTPSSYSRKGRMSESVSKKQLNDLSPKKQPKSSPKKHELSPKKLSTESLQKKQPSELSHKKQPSELSHQKQSSELSHKKQSSELSHKKQSSELTQKKQSSELINKKQPNDTNQKKQPNDTNQKKQPSDTNQKNQPSDINQKNQPTEGSPKKSGKSKKKN